MLAPHAIGRLSFDGVRVERADVLGEVDGGFSVAMRTLDVLRPSVGAFAVGMAQAALDAAIDTRDAARGLRRRAGRPAGCPAPAGRDGHPPGRPAGCWSTRRHRAYDAGRRRPSVVTRKAAMAKLFATESAQFVVDAAVQLHGARALQRGHLLEHLYREVRAPRIYEGASEVQRTIIGRSLVAAPADEQAERSTELIPVGPRARC